MSVQVIDEISGKYKVVKNIGSSHKAFDIDRLVLKGKEYIKQQKGLQELDFKKHDSIYQQVLTSITSHELVGMYLVLGRIFDQIGFDQIKSDRNTSKYL